MEGDRWEGTEGRKGEGVIILLEPIHVQRRDDEMSIVRGSGKGSIRKEEDIPLVPSSRH